jgi:tetratricopeptide (TPR) repeat protein
LCLGFILLRVLRDSAVKSDFFDLSMMMTRKLLAVAVLVLVLPLGCDKPQNRKPSPTPRAPQGDNKPGEAKTPYYPGLIEEYQNVLAEDPHNLVALIGSGNAYYDSGEWKKAIAMYERALEIDPRNADVRTDMGTAYRNLGMPERALAEYLLALQHEPGHLNARYNLGIVYANDKKDYAAAIRVWEEILRIAPNYPHAGQLRSMIAALKAKKTQATR